MAKRNPHDAWPHLLRVLTPLFLFLVGVLASGGCSCSPDLPPPPPQHLPRCKAHKAPPATVPPDATRTTTVSAGSIPATFSVSSTGEATYTMPLVTVPGRAGVEPELALTYDSSAGDGLLGMGFSLAGLSAITRCPQSLAQDGEIRAVRYDAADKLCLGGKRLVVVKKAPGIIEYRTFPDTFTKVVGHYPLEEGVPAHALSFEAFTPSGLTIDYGTSDSSRPVTPGGVPRAWLATKAHDGRGNAMSYAYCTGAEEALSAEVAIDAIRYTSFEGTPALEPSRAVQFVYGTKDTADIRTLYAGGMELQSALRLEEIQMLGPGDALVRRYALTYGLGPTTHRTLLTQVEECAGDGVCKPPTRFQFSSSAAGFKKRTTSLPTPTAERASPMLLDLDGDGLDDLVLPDTNKVLSTPDNPLTDWLVARNEGASASGAYLSSTKLAFSQDAAIVTDPFGPADPTVLEPELGTAIDYNQDRQMDVFLHDVHGSRPTWQVLLGQPDHTFQQLDTGIARPFPLGASPKPPHLTSPGASVHLADLDGNGVPDLIQCQDHSAEDVGTGDPSGPAWTVHLWKPAGGATPAGFDAAGQTIEALAGFRCDTELYTLDLNGDGKVDLVVESMVLIDGTQAIPGGTYSALSRRHDGTWEIFDTQLPILETGRRVVFADVNGDGLPDAVLAGFEDHALRTFLNTGSTFSAAPVNSLASPGLGDQDTYFRLATPIDFNGDGRQDLLMPVPPATLPDQSEVLPAWAILQATGTAEGPTFTLVDPQIPFEAEIGGAITLADPHGPRIGDLNGDGAQDVILPLGGVFTVFENLAPDQDLLVAVADGMNAHDPGDPGFTPNVSVAYGHLTDASITRGAAEGDSSRESDLYLSRADAANDCAYPRSCAVGPRRVVRAYAVNNGADGLRRFGVRYRDGRYHRLGRGFLGFAARLVTDLDTGAGTADFSDNITFHDTDGLKIFPFAGQVQKQWRWSPGLPSQPKPDQIELSFTDLTPTLVPTNDNATYFTLPTERRVRRVQGVYSPRGSAPTVEAYVQQIAVSGGATVLHDSVAKVADFDTFGNVKAEELSTTGVDLSLHVERTFKNDTDRWVLGQLQTQKECSAAAGRAQCRTLTRTTTIFGEVDTAATGSDDGSPDTVLHLAYTRDAFGNILATTADDAHGHHRVSSTTFDAEGLFPETSTNAAGHLTRTTFDAGLGVLTKLTDPNQLVTQRKHDGFGRLGLETRPDGTETTLTLSRTKDGGPNHNAWRVLERSTTTGGADDTVELDSLGRPIRWRWYGPQPQRGSGEPLRLMQQIGYDARGEHVARRSVPVREDTPEDELRFDVFDHDALGREVQHTTPWGAVVQTAHEGAIVRVTDPLKHESVMEHDPLGRTVTITDAALGVTRYTYGPFGTLETVTDPGGALTRFTRDAFGRVTQLDDPDRGTSISTHDGFGELLSTSDALGRVTTWIPDALGRPHTRVDQEGAQMLTTTWTWDTAANGIGKLQQLTSPDGQKTSTYNGFSQLETLTLVLQGQSDSFQARLGYDKFSRVETLTYPTPAGAAPFVVAQDHDPHGHVVTVRDSATDLPYWRLTDVDSAGRFRKEVFGNDVSTERSYFDDKQTLESIVTQHGGTTVQDLAYGYDARRNLTSRTDALQPESPTERFRYDPLERLTCAYFGLIESDTASCEFVYDHHPNGNLTLKADVGPFAYEDPAHPHAVTRAGSESFGYNAVGNQTTRPGGVTVSYTPFDLPKTITQGANAVSFGYDGDAQRIRKTTPVAETLYLGDLYERVTEAVSGAVAHRYYVHAPERVVAVVTRGGDQEGTRYLHVDPLGSVNALTDASGAVVERRTYDPFGQRRATVWGEPTPASFPSLTTQGFTGHESDDELGLVNMKGRIYDPKTGRFLTPDPLVADPLFGQSWNPYSYVRNNPLNFVDPSGFAPGDGSVTQPGYPDVSLPDDVVTASPAFQMARYLNGGPPPGQPPRVQEAKPTEGPPEAAEVGAAGRPIDVNPTGSSSGYVPQPSAAPQADGTGSASSWPWYEAPFHFNDRARAWIAEDELHQRQSGAGGAPPALMGGSHPIAGSLPIIGLAVSMPSDTSAAPADVLSAAGSLAGLKVLQSFRLPGAARGPAATRELAQQIANVERVPMRFRRTVTLVETAEGPTLVAGGASDLSAAQIAAARRLGLTPAPPLPGVHAEPTAIFGAGELGLTPTRGVTTNAICTGPGGCTTFIEGLGGQVTGKNTFEF